MRFKNTARDKVYWVERYDGTWVGVVGFDSRPNSDTEGLWVTDRDMLPIDRENDPCGVLAQYSQGFKTRREAGESLNEKPSAAALLLIDKGY